MPGFDFYAKNRFFRPVQKAPWISGGSFQVKSLLLPPSWQSQLTLQPGSKNGLLGWW